ncbi:proline-rich receptor-like protein kinase PERK8 [Salvia hispanica]|uniref:proline-rich receptor-like protein kinase PERK8 n=1 Tax=Salvia hispanica TaxID=49212 RepID=UPI0020091642|nr:proline-rich receptor-like protein kinase PERK8 [Salvia hispanica]
MAFNPIPNINNIYRFTVPQIQHAIRNRHELGRGGFGVVYRGTIRRHGERTRAAAFKMVLRGDYFRQEVNVLDIVRSRYVINLLGVCEDLQTIVIEYAQNRTLSYHLRRPDSMTTFPWCTRIKVLLGLCRALTHVHVCGYIHRDVKSENVLLLNDFTPKLSDFGAAIMIDEEPHPIILSMGYTDPGYLNPDETENVKFHLDIYSLGVVILETLSGRPAFEIDRFGRAFRLDTWVRGLLPEEILHEDFRDLEQAPDVMIAALDGENTNIPEALKDCVIIARRCLNPDVAQRPNFIQIRDVLLACPRAANYARWRNAVGNA